MGGFLLLSLLRYVSQFSITGQPNVQGLESLLLFVLVKMSIPSVGQLLFTKYTPPAATVLILWDHCLTLDEELTVIWRSFKGQNLSKFIYIMNRPFTEAVMLYTIYVFTGLGGSTSNKVTAFWLFTMSATILAGILQSVIMLRAYHLWDHEQTVGRVLLAVFVGCITGMFALSVKTVILLLRSRVQLPLSEDACAVHSGVPKTIVFLMGIMLFFNLFVILVTLYNALEIPRRSEHEILDSLRRDGARVYVVSFVLWMLLLTASVTIEMRSFFSILMFVWALKANIAARMHLRIETLRFFDTGDPVGIYTG
ncbi:hypothetical protein IW261DRAFT_1438517 [Armillaria novae-zelandiae]|uniref:DUF6533 domain-containing protein n=1 Tax=Armillaria novae-zelandiae TaxID=153914 RepID=A0AA39PXK6_9AGAR|nr:hypothetical protein IW261DRAFT_1438517 [Armillaria novae-zelandiae]